MRKLPSEDVKPHLIRFLKAYKEAFGCYPDIERVHGVLSENLAQKQKTFIENGLCDHDALTLADFITALKSFDLKELEADDKPADKEKPRRTRQVRTGASRSRKSNKKASSKTPANPA